MVGGSSGNNEEEVTHATDKGGDMVGGAGIRRLLLIVRLLLLLVVVVIPGRGFIDDDACFGFSSFPCFSFISRSFNTIRCDILQVYIFDR